MSSVQRNHRPAHSGASGHSTGAGAQGATEEQGALDLCQMWHHNNRQTAQATPALPAWGESMIDPRSFIVGFALGAVVTVLIAAGLNIIEQYSILRSLRQGERRKP